MGFYLHIDVDSSLTPTQFQDQVVTPLGEELEREGLGRILDLDPEDAAASQGHFVLALEVTDQQRAHAVVEKFLKTSKSCE